MTARDPETELRAMWTADGISPERQDELVAQIAAKAAPGAMIGPFRSPDCVQDLQLAQVEPDPDQPRKTFDRIALGELAASIAANGLLQPITVRQVAPGHYRIVAGERRFRAHQINRSPTIRALVISPPDQSDIRVKQIIENEQRVDVSPLEQARCYQALMDEAGWSVAELAGKIGKAPHRITERTALLTLEPEYQSLLASGNLTPSQATELVRVGTGRGQAVLFDLIRTGSCKTYSDLRAAGTAIVGAQAQYVLMPEMPPAPTQQDNEQANAFEAHADRIVALLRSGIQDNQIVAVRKVSPHRASHVADLFKVMQGEMRRIELALREAAIQASLLTA